LQKKQTPLHLAAADGQLEVCRLLLELGASIDATDELGQKPIHVAAQNNYSAVVALFLQKHPQLAGANTKVSLLFSKSQHSSYINLNLLGWKHLRPHCSNAWFSASD
jgi:ankyrin repeat protein